MTPGGKALGVVTLALALLAGGLAAAPGGVAGAAVEPGVDRSLAVFPRQQIPLRFHHGKHLAADMGCTACHDVETSGASSDLNLPKEESCASCHDIEAAKAGEATDPPSACSVCHPGFDPTAAKAPRAWSFPAPNLKFPHDVHLKRNIPCGRCHGDMTKVALATRDQLPKMETCLDCHHAGGDAPAACSTCHLTDAAGTVGKLQPNGAVLIPGPGNPFGIGHGARYEREHGAQALASRELCSECHGIGDCLRCHDAAAKNLKFHPNDWVTLHPVPAKHGALACSGCHNHQQFCATCHERSGLGRDSDDRFRPASLRVHPPAELWVDRRGPQHHGVWASRDIQSCASCHREEACLTCHAVSERLGGAGGISPHPSGFRAQACSMWRKNARVCLKCHRPQDASIRECQ